MGANARDRSTPTRQRIRIGKHLRSEAVMSGPQQVAGVQTGLIQHSRRFSAFGLLRIQETEQLIARAFECFGSRVIRVPFDEAIRRVERFGVAA